MQFYKYPPEVSAISKNIRTNIVQNNREDLKI